MQFSCHEFWISKKKLVGDLPTNTWEVGYTHAEVKTAFFTTQAAVETRKGLVAWLKEDLQLRGDQASVYHNNALICVDAYAYPIGLCDLPDGKNNFFFRLV